MKQSYNSFGLTNEQKKKNFSVNNLTNSRLGGNNNQKTENRKHEMYGKKKTFPNQILKPMTFS